MAKKMAIILPIPERSRYAISGYQTSMMFSSLKMNIKKFYKVNPILMLWHIILKHSIFLMK